MSHYTILYNFWYLIVKYKQHVHKYKSQIFKYVKFVAIIITIEDVACFVAFKKKTTLSPLQQHGARCTHVWPQLSSHTNISLSYWFVNITLMCNPLYFVTLTCSVPEPSPKKRERDTVFLDLRNFDVTRQEQQSNIERVQRILQIQPEKGWVFTWRESGILSLPQQYVTD